MRDNQLRNLRILHLSKRAATVVALSCRAESFPGTFFFDSCQRAMWIGFHDGRPRLAPPPGVECYSGEQAYLFLLRVATGLESAIAGETDVFGQLKEAWRSFEKFAEQSEQGELARDLGAWMQKIFEDTKEVRSRHLENLGGASYGTLARRLPNLGEADRLFIVGAGSIARSVLPFLLQFRLTLWNRTQSTAHELAAELRTQGARHLDVVESEADGWRKATHALVCIPLDTTAEGDTLRIALWNTHDATLTAQKRLILHMGCLRGQSVATWETLPEFRSLDNLFELRSAQAEARDLKLGLARRMCVERAQQRTLGGSLTMAHGWEDLGVFV